jgi:hypothetical protein
MPDSSDPDYVDMVYSFFNDNFPAGTAYLVVMKRPDDDTPGIMSTLDSEEEIAYVLSKLAQKLRGDA